MKSLLKLLDTCVAGAMGILFWGAVRRWMYTSPPEGLDFWGRIGWHFGDMVGAASQFLDGVPVLLAVGLVLAWAALHGAYLTFGWLSGTVSRLPSAVGRGAGRVVGEATRAFKSGRDEASRG